MDITFPGGLVIEARHESFIIRTDQTKEAGGTGSAPSPFTLFLASLGTCAGFYALSFCQERNIAVDGMKLAMDWDRNAATHRLDRVRLKLTLPDGFPEKYRKAIVKAMDQCTVKKTLFDPPEFILVAE